ncbi:MAG TPA: GNAT family N-acetyltransferase [Solirubrobacteraceae bacterium]|jgi:CelD/BcsL family acetyltransferase involved in cellulose biosynthesis|nr:GNAT family N-acetyltransferase [Solirubrobacteraceae bacterium]
MVETWWVTTRQLAAELSPIVPSSSATLEHGRPIADTCGSPPVKLELLPIDVSGLAAWEEEWRELEHKATDNSVYTSYDWLQAWAKIYKPRKLLLAHAVEPDDGTTASLGLIEVDRVGGWRFAGGLISPCRAPLCAAGRGEAVWRALAAWLQANPRAWSTVEACEVGETAQAIPGARLETRITPCLTLPSSFDDHLASLSAKQRHEARRRLRRTQEAGVEVSRVPSGAVDGALADLLRLHHRRADIKGMNTNLDGRLVQMLRGISTSSSIELRVFEVLSKGERVGVSVDLAYGGVSYPYVLGWDPRTSNLAPGILLALNAITASLQEGLHAIDLGPGDQTYKLALGFVPESRFVLEATNPSPWGHALRAAGTTYARLRSRSTRLVTSR